MYMHFEIKDVSQCSQVSFLHLPLLLPVEHIQKQFMITVCTYISVLDKRRWRINEVNLHKYMPLVVRATPRNLEFSIFTNKANSLHLSGDLAYFQAVSAPAAISA